MGRAPARLGRGRAVGGEPEYEFFCDHCDETIEDGEVRFECRVCAGSGASAGLHALSIRRRRGCLGAFARRSSAGSPCPAWCARPRRNSGPPMLEVRRPPRHVLVLGAIMTARDLPHPELRACAGGAARPRILRLQRSTRSGRLAHRGAEASRDARARPRRRRRASPAGARAADGNETAGGAPRASGPKLLLRAVGAVAEEVASASTGPSAPSAPPLAGDRVGRRFGFGGSAPRVSSTSSAPRARRPRRHQRARRAALARARTRARPRVEARASACTRAGGAVARAAVVGAHGPRARSP